ncbi:oligopeptide/dipeptide ABC transporter, ATPase subunit [Alicyclobacillus hesperidum URH17-3-68]|uniref:ABC transporter ATP-binding protein n=1 Tax=Alicyclobacillus hesperidum TaxID=89784 RepID=A0A1H2QDA6_9BACL|nr:dipeptide ABC transporter ATP-binding protein [Alicyclobacillus hesperidum]EJY54699.1 oligopeptide/dipeptide ABC transporter, ATPase subunit [Alicyclobacillus hesperidum URH17-3-68]GLG01439.1 ABC transporter ATP-binding protein [Alicyclobacillus hesperidum subsp. aegles]GLV12685.1 ABC transporter ATP-binding protein [Alicyclobacillus hesperidum]SDW05227.1 peptide/nickel transport system ATP-binding protein [Alicyclobacillus hesperidum]
MSQYVLEVKDLKKYFPIRSGVFKRTIGHVRAVDGVSFDVKPGETLGIVGESGCGKSTTGRMIMRLTTPTDGKILIDGKDITHAKGAALRESRRHAQMVFQDPYASLNPKMSVGESIAEPLIVNKVLSRDDAFERAAQLLDTVGLRRTDITRFPHEFSGGQRQRIGIARALALNPKLIVADEAVSALDVSIQSQILNLLMDLKHEFNLAYLFISHNLAVVRHISDRVGVMYLGHMVENGPKSSLYADPLHPYTQALLSAAPEPRRVKRRERIILQGDVPSPANPPTGCPFHTRCPRAMDVCRSQMPKPVMVHPEHWVACHLHG